MNNISMVLEIMIFKFSCILKIMSRNTFTEPQPDSASYVLRAGSVEFFLCENKHEVFTTPGSGCFCYIPGIQTDIATNRQTSAFDRFIENSTPT